MKSGAWECRALLVVALLGTTVAALGQPVINSQPSNQVVWAGGTASLAVAATGAGPLTYQWQENGTNLPLAMITTVAGGGPNYPGDGDYATNAELHGPVDIAVDAAGQLYVVQNWGRVCKIDTNDIITTVAGGGPNDPGNGGYATNASLNLPTAMVLDDAGGYFICESDNNLVRRVDAEGIITTVAGDGTDGCPEGFGYATNASLDAPFALAWDSASNLFIGTCGAVFNVGFGETISEVTPPEFAYPAGIAIDPSGNQYLSDGAPDDRVYYINYNGLAIVTVAGGGTNWADGIAATNAALSFPLGLTLDRAGNLYIADVGDNRVRKVDSNGIITTVAGNRVSGYSGDGGGATNASLDGPRKVGFDPEGNMYIDDGLNNVIRKVSFVGLPTLIRSNVGSYDVVVSDSTGSVTSSVVTLTVVPRPTVTITPTNQLVWTGSTVTYAASISYQGAVNWQWQFNGSNIAGASDSTLTLDNVSTAQAGYYDAVATGPANSGTVTSGQVSLDVAIPPQSQTVWAGANVTLSTAVAGPGIFTYQWQCDGTNLPPDVITTVAGNGTAGYAGDGGAATNAELDFPEGADGYPCGIASDNNGNLFIPDINNNRIRKVSTNAIITTVAGNSEAGYSGDGGQATNAALSSPLGVAADNSGNLFIADFGNQRIRKVDPNGIISTVVGNGTNGYSGDGGEATNASLGDPTGVAVDTHGNLFVVDFAGGRIRKIGTNGIIVTIAGDGSRGYNGDGIYATNSDLSFPSQVTVDTLGNVFISDTGNNRIRRVDTNGIITTVAGGGQGSDGGEATNAILDYPQGVAVGHLGNLFIADTFSQRIREVEANGLITTVAGDGIAGFSGDGKPGTLTVLSYPSGVALDSAGNLLIADEGSQRIRRLSASGLTTINLYDLDADAVVNCSIVAVGAAESVTSSAVNITIATGPQILNIFHNNDGAVTLNLLSNPNSSSRVLTATNLAQPILWQPIYTNIPAPDGLWQFSDTDAVVAAKFYRISTP